MIDKEKSTNSSNFQSNCNQATQNCSPVHRYQRVNPDTSRVEEEEEEEGQEEGEEKRIGKGGERRRGDKKRRSRRKRNRKSSGRRRRGGGSRRKGRERRKGDRKRRRGRRKENKKRKIREEGGTSSKEDGVERRRGRKQEEDRMEVKNSVPLLSRPFYMSRAHSGTRKPTGPEHIRRADPNQHSLSSICAHMEVHVTTSLDAIFLASKRGKHSVQLVQKRQTA